VEVQLHSSLASEVDINEQSTSRPSL
jgi:hypothetical protein